MATFTVDELVKAAEQLPQIDLENLTAQVLTLKARRAAPELSKNEAELLRNINRGMPDALQNRYRELIAIRRSETLTESEHAELLHLTNQVEKHDAERLKYLTKLARIRKISLTKLLDELGIEPAYT
ncbi:MAG: STAS/SEC14 domain-containing protein [Candidatus Poribacteria bacterium]|nr:STAS/SEC14 domain-containing protein [Candidatus Poribacteria bacterium]